jgi:tetratricopeptide (TPR) repeat protein
MPTFFSIGTRAPSSSRIRFGQVPAAAARLAATVVVGVWACLAQAQEPNGSLGEAQRLLKQGKHSAALSSVDAHLAGNPKDAQGRFLKGLILTEQERLEEATAVFVGLTADYPELPEPYNNLAVLYAQQRQYEKARTALEMAIRTHPAYAIAYENLGDVYAKLASQAYDRALQIDSGNSVAQGKLSLIRELFGTTTRDSRAAGEPAAEPVRTAAAKAPTKPVPARPLAAAASPAVVKSVPVVAAAPAAAASKSAPSIAPSPAASQTLQEITRALESWALAWSTKDVAGYLAHYDDAYRPDESTSHEDWRTSRAQRVGKPGDIEVSIADIRVDVDATGQATARFHQRYRSSNLNSNTNKTMVLKRVGERWVIVEERLG